LAKFEEHIKQAKQNLEFLNKVNQQIDNHYDWQVTICFYVAVHLANARISKFGVQYRKHIDVNYALNPENITSICKLPEDEYVSYIILHNLSRRARYLVNDKPEDIKNANAFFTYEKHFAKAIRHLDKLLTYFSTSYQITFDATTIKCAIINDNEELFVFKK
jgi:hypothetical protein